MPKARSAILSSLRGSLRGGPTFRATSQTPDIVMQTRPVPTGPPTAKQSNVRDAYSRLGFLWKNLSHLDKEPYQIMAEARNLTPWNCWLSFHLPLMRLTPKFYTTFSEGAGTTIQDFAIGGLSGNILGPVWSEKNQYPHLVFDGVDDGLLFNRPGYYDTSNIFSLFFMLQDTAANKKWSTMMTTKAYGADLRGFWFGHNGDDDLVIYTSNGTAYNYVLSPVIWSRNALHTIGYVCNGSNSFFYMNGKKYTSATVPLGCAPSTRALKLGTQISPANSFTGPIHVAAKFDKALSLANFNALDAHFRPFFT